MTDGDRLDTIEQQLQFLLSATMRQAQNIETLVAGIGQLLEATTDLRLALTESTQKTRDDMAGIKSDIVELSELARQQYQSIQALAETSQSQQQTIQALVTTAQLQAETAARQQQMLERLLQQRN